MIEIRQTNKRTERIFPKDLNIEKSPVNVFNVFENYLFCQSDYISINNKLSFHCTDYTPAQRARISKNGGKKPLAFSDGYITFRRIFRKTITTAEGV